MKSVCAAILLAVPMLGACKVEEPEPVDTALVFDGVVTCTWIEENNCWRDFAPSMVECRSLLVDDYGWFNDERNTCSYDDGVWTQFNQSIPADGDIDQIEDFGFNMYDSAGGVCLSWTQWADDYEYGYKMTFGDAVFEAYGYGSQGWFRCPDDTLWEVENLWELYECDSLIKISPGVAVYSQDTKFGVNLIGLAEGSEVLMQCENPATE